MAPSECGECSEDWNGALASGRVSGSRLGGVRLDPRGALNVVSTLDGVAEEYVNTCLSVEDIAKLVLAKDFVFEPNGCL